MKQVAAEITVHWVDEFHTLKLSLPQWRKIHLAKDVTVRGPGYSYEGERFQEYWTFTEGLYGQLAVWTKDGGSCFQGDLQETEIEEQIFPVVNVGKRTVLDVRKHSRNGFTFKHYLCLSKKNAAEAVLELCRYEALAEYTHRDLEGNPLEVPKIVKGKKVFAFEYGWLYGGELQCYGMGDNFVFKLTEVSKANVWLMSKGYFLSPSALDLLTKIFDE